MPYKDPIKAKEYRHRVYVLNKDKYKIQNKLYRESHKEKLSDYGKRYRMNNLEKSRKYDEEYKKKNSEKLKKYSREYNAKRRQNPEVREQRNKHARIKRLEYYGITEEDFQKILDEQNGVCAICGRPSKTRSLDVDHEHQKQEKKRSPDSRRARIRGLLCHRCNRALGLFGNDLQMLMFASKNFAEYIEKYYAKRLADQFGYEEAKRQMENTVEYLSSFEKRKPK